MYTALHLSVRLSAHHKPVFHEEIENRKSYVLYKTATLSMTLSNSSHPCFTLLRLFSYLWNGWS